MDEVGDGINYIETMEEMIVLLAMAAMRVTAWCMMVLLGEEKILKGKCWLKYCRPKIKQCEVERQSLR